MSNYSTKSNYSNNYYYINKSNNNNSNCNTIDVITEIAEDCLGFESSLLGRCYGLLIRI